MGIESRRWQITSSDGQPPKDLPSPWASAVAAVRRDLHCRRHGREINVDLVVWELTANSDGSMYIGMVIASKPDGLRPISGGSGFTVDASAAQATVWVAEKTQDELTGYEFVQWPTAGHRLLIPKLQNGEAVWVNASVDSVVAPIGALTNEPHLAG